MFSKTVFVVFALIMLSCVSTKNPPQNIETNTPAEIEAKKIAGEKMMEAGYLPGRIIYSDLADDCEYTIQLKDGDRDFYYVDPINLNEKFNNDGQTIWVKFTGLNTTNRCEKAVPVNIMEIENRDE